jgi:hypothetical protein
MNSTVDLIGDGIENPWNAKAMIDIAGAFECGEEIFLDDLLCY